jgi:hypothetical protein
MLWARLLAYVTGTVHQELLWQRISGGGEPDPERSDPGSAAAFRWRKVTLAEIAHRLGRMALEEVRQRQARYDSGVVSKAHRQEIR